MALMKYSDKHHEIGKTHHRVLFKLEMDKRYMPDVNDQSLVQVVGAMSREKAKRIWEIVLEPDPIPQKEPE